MSRVLSRWEERGIVAAGRQRLVVRVPHAFAEIAEDLEQPSDSGEPG